MSKNIKKIKTKTKRNFAKIRKLKKYIELTIFFLLIKYLDC